MRKGRKEEREMEGEERKSEGRSKGRDREARQTDVQTDYYIIVPHLGNFDVKFCVNFYGA